MFGLSSIMKILGGAADLIGIGKKQQEANIRQGERQVGAEVQRGKDAEAEAEERRKDHGVSMEAMDVEKATKTAKDLADD